MTPSEAARLRRIVNDMVIEHDSFHQMLRRMDTLWLDAQSRIPVVALFVGETGTGKSTAIRAFFARHPRTRTPDGLTTPVLVVNTPSKPTPLNLAERLLHALGDPRPTAGSAAAKLDRIIELLAACGVLIVILDDIQHFVDKRQQIALFDASDYLKELLISYGVVLLCFGLPESELVIESNEQLKTRSNGVFELCRFDWTNPTSQDQFVAVLAAFQRGIPTLELPDLASPELSLRMYLATGGLIRYVSAVLGKAVRNAVDQRKTKICLKDLSTAWSEEILGAKKDYEDPFSRGFKFNDLPVKVAHAKTLGQRVTRPMSRHGRKPGAVLREIGL